MKLEFISNAGVLVELKSGARIMCDPWIYGRAFFGSWHPYPPLSTAQQERYVTMHIDALYISHLHTDHLDPETLKRLRKDVPVFVGKLAHDHLVRAIKGLGFTDVRELTLETKTPFGGGEIAIFGPFGTMGDGSIDRTGYELDTSIWFRDADGQTLFHSIDNPIKATDAARIREQFGTPDIAILPYSGASMYPHAFPAYSDTEKAARRDAVKAARLGHLTDVAAAMRARWVVPAAGSYVMGGKLAEYSDYLHQATPDEVHAAWSAAGAAPEQLRVMRTGDVLDSASGVLTPADTKSRSFTHEDRLAYARSLADELMPHEQITLPPLFAVPWARLLPKARASMWRAQKRLELFLPVDVEIVLRGTPGVPLPGNRDVHFRFALDQEQPGPKHDAWVRFTLDASLMIPLLLGAAIWNNVEGGAHVLCEREPDRYDASVHSLMSFFAL